MRTEDSIKNSLSSVITNFTAILFSFIAQAVFVRSLGVEYLGLNGLFSNILTLLSLFEVGVGSAIVYSIYRPIAVNDIEKIKSLTWLYKKTYRVIAVLIFFVGIFLIPILQRLVKDVTVSINLNLIYVLFLVSSIINYLIADKRSLIIAYQKLYIINILHTIYFVLLYTGQIIVLVIFKNYYLYLVVKILSQMIEMVAIHVITVHKFPFLLEKDISKLDKDEEKSIFEKVKALILHKVGSVIVNGTDNIIISAYIGIAAVGIYSNYYLILNAVNMLFGQIITSITSSIGNLLVENDSIKSFDVFKKMRFLNFWISCFTSISILLIIQPFVSLWLGNQYLLEEIVVAVLVFNFFQKMMRGAYSTFKDAGGIWREDRFIPLIESLINIIVSIILAKAIGLTGVFIGTIVSGFVLWFYSYPKFIYCKLFKRTIKDYLKETIGYIAFFCVLMFVSLIFEEFLTSIQLDLWILLGINVVWCLVVPNIVLYISFYRTENFKYFNLILNQIFTSVKARQQ